MSELWEAAKGIYSITLIVALLALAWGVRPALRVLKALSEALDRHAGALQRAASNDEVQANTAQKVDEIHAVLCKKKPPA